MEQKNHPELVPILLPHQTVRHIKRWLFKVRHVVVGHLSVDQKIMLCRHEKNLLSLLIISTASAYFPFHDNILWS